MVVFYLIALRLSVLSDSGREDRSVLKGGTQRGKEAKNMGDGSSLTQRREDAKRKGIWDGVGRGVFGWLFFG